MNFMVDLFYYTKEGKINKKELKQINNKHIAVMKCVYNMVQKVEIEMYEMSHVSRQPVTCLCVFNGFPGNG